MTSKKNKMILIDQNKITLPPDFIPQNATHFLIEAMQDGRLILSPVSQSAPQKPEKIEGLAEVVDISLARKRSKKIEPRKQRQGGEEKENDGFSAEDGFVGLHHFPSRMEAEMIGEILKQAGLPFLIQSEDIGIFGPSAAPAPGGAGLVVRRSNLEYARTLLAGLI